ncbi:hypothetical protein U1Q18_016441 [Sarracenia purpurea var. burkii]
MSPPSLRKQIKEKSYKSMLGFLAHWGEVIAVSFPLRKIPSSKLLDMVSDKEVDQVEENTAEMDLVIKAAAIERALADNKFQQLTEMRNSSLAKVGISSSVPLGNGSHAQNYTLLCATSSPEFFATISRVYFFFSRVLRDDYQGFLFALGFFSRILRLTISRVSFLLLASSPEFFEELDD